MRRTSTLVFLVAALSWGCTKKEAPPEPATVAPATVEEHVAEPPPDAATAPAPAVEEAVEPKSDEGGSDEIPAPPNAQEKPGIPTKGSMIEVLGSSPEEAPAIHRRLPKARKSSASSDDEKAKPTPIGD